MESIIHKFVAMQEQDATRDLCPPLQYLPKDRRLKQVVCTETEFTFHPWRSREEWEQRKNALKMQIQIAAGLYPYPEKTPLNPKIFDEQNYGTYTVAKFTIESCPGFYVTGNIFKPVGKKHVPAILNPHGHWDSGRNEMGEDCSVVARCANFAQMGILAISYDMIGYQDSRQVSHGFGQSADCQKWAISGFGLQLWNSIRVLDFVDGMDEVDRSRIGCTGASGGGTQTFMLAALDERIAAAVPVNMVGLLMQGGCACENAPLLRIDTNNLELVSMTAPRPMLLIGSTGDWTCNLLTADYPAVKSIYALYGAEDKLEKFYHDAEHNYNFTARYPVYRFFARHFLHDDREWIEKPVQLSPEELRIFRGNEKPAQGIQSNEEMVAYLKNERKERVTRHFADGTGAVQDYRKAMRFLLNLHDEPIEAYQMETTVMDGVCLQQGFLGSAKYGEQIPCCSVQRENTVPERCELWLSDEGKYQALSQIEALRSDTLYVGVDLFLTGSYQQPWGKSGRNIPLADFFTAFNYTDDVLMADDIWNTYRYLKKRFSEISIHAEGRTAELSSLLAAFIPEAAAYLKYGCKNLFVPCFESIGGEETCAKLAYR